MLPSMKRAPLDSIRLKPEQYPARQVPSPPRHSCSGIYEWKGGRLRPPDRYVYPITGGGDLSTAGHHTQTSGMRAVENSAAGDDSTGTGCAHAKVILLGEHAVVYGAPGLAVPLSQLTTTARAVQEPQRVAEREEIWFASGQTTAAMPAEAVGGLRDLVAQFKQNHDVSEQTSLQVVVESTIPPGRGLGASAASARAVALALADLFGCELDAKAVFDLVQTAETAAHGRSSGIDAIATGSAAPIRYVSGVADELSCGFDGVFVVADSGVSGRTKDAIEHVRRVFDADPQVKADFLQQVSRLAETGVQSFVGGQASVFGAKLTENHQLLRALGLSTEHIDRLVDAALQAGSRGAKISGGGLGGCMVALTANQDEAHAVAVALRAAGAVSTWLAPVGRLADADE